MKAGRELDALVAEKVMGWELNDEDSLSWIDSQGKFRTWEDTSFKSFRPSEDIAAAWEVVEKLCNWDVDDNMLVLKGQGPDLEKKEWPNGEAAEWWEAEINGTWGKVVGEAETAPHAICLAALKVKGIDIDT